MAEGLRLDLRCQICQPVDKAATEFEGLPDPPQFIVPCKFSHYGVAYDDTIVTQRLTDDKVPATAELFYWFAIDNRYVIEASSLLVFDSPRSHFRVEKIEFAGRYYIVCAELEIRPIFSTTQISSNRLNLFLFPRLVASNQPTDIPDPMPFTLFSYSFSPATVDIVEGGTAQTTLTFVGIPPTASDLDVASYEFIFSDNNRLISLPRGISVSRNNTVFPITLIANNINEILPDLSFQLIPVDDVMASGEFRTFGVAHNPTNLTINWSHDSPQP